MNLDARHAFFRPVVRGSDQSTIHFYLLTRVFSLTSEHYVLPPRQCIPAQLSNLLKVAGSTSDL